MIDRGANRAIRSPWSQRGISLFMTLCIVLLALAIVTGRLCLVARSDPGGNIQNLVQYIAAEHHPFSQPKNRLILVADIGDLTCPPCFDDLIALAESLSVRTELARAGRVMVLLTDGRSGDDICPEVLKHWAEETGLLFPNIVAGSSLLDSFGLRNSQAVVIDPSDHLHYQRKFPLGEQGRADLLAMIEVPD